MRLVMTLLVRDEEELLPVTLVYHLRRGVDFVLVTDHGSTDATPEILEEYVSRGVARVLRVEDEAYDQSKWVTRMAAWPPSSTAPTGSSTTTPTSSGGRWPAPCRTCWPW